MKDLRKSHAKAKANGVDVGATGAVDDDTSKYRAMWRLPRDITFCQISGRTGVELQLLLQENPFGGGGKLNEWQHPSGGRHCGLHG